MIPYNVWRWVRWLVWGGVVFGVVWILLEIFQPSYATAEHIRHQLVHQIVAWLVMWLIILWRRLWAAVIAYGEEAMDKPALVLRQRPVDVDAIDVEEETDAP